MQGLSSPTLNINSKIIKIRINPFEVGAFIVDRFSYLCLLLPYCHIRFLQPVRAEL